MDERDLVQQLAVKSERVATIRALMGGITATELRRSTTRPETFAALVEGLDDPHPQIRYWCVALLDHVPDHPIAAVIAPRLDDPVPRVRRMAAHALGCTGCRPGCPIDLPAPLLARLSAVADDDPNAKVRAEARYALANLGCP